MNANRYRRYVVSTLAYGAVGVAAFAAALYFVFAEKRFLLVLIAAAAAYVALDNFFCGDRARACGFKAKGHHVVPPFLKR